MRPRIILWLGIIAGALLFLASHAFAVGSTCTLTGNVQLLSGGAAASQRVFFSWPQMQNPQSLGSVIPGGSFSVLTDASGNLQTGACAPTGPKPCLPQGAHVNVSSGEGEPTQIWIPLQSSADIQTLIMAVSDPPSLVSDIALTNAGAASVTNPPLGAIGTATLDLANAFLPGGGTPGQFLMEGASAPGWFTETGDMSCSTTKIGNCTVEPKNFIYQVSGKPATGLITPNPMPYDVTFPANLMAGTYANDSMCTWITAATGSAAFLIRDCDTAGSCTTKATATVAAGARVCTFSTQAAFTVVAGHLLTVVAPTQDATLSDGAFAIGGQR